MGLQRYILQGVVYTVRNVGNAKRGHQRYLESIAEIETAETGEAA